MSQSEKVMRLVQGSENINLMQKDIRVVCGLIISSLDKHYGSRMMSKLEESSRLGPDGWSLFRNHNCSGFELQYVAPVHSLDRDTCFAFTSARPHEQYLDHTQFVWEHLPSMVEWIRTKFPKIERELQFLDAASRVQLD